MDTQQPMHKRALEIDVLVKLTATGRRFENSVAASHLAEGLTN